MRSNVTEPTGTAVQPSSRCSSCCKLRKLTSTCTVYSEGRRGSSSLPGWGGQTFLGLKLALRGGADFY